MNGETFSVLVWFWNDVQTHNTIIRVLRIDTGEHVELKSGSFLLRITTDAIEMRDATSDADDSERGPYDSVALKGRDVEIVRCLIRHLPTGNEVHVQSGSALQTFILSSLLDPPESGTTI